MLNLDHSGLPALLFFPSSAEEYALFIIIGIALAAILLSGESRKKALARTASELGLQFFPMLSADQMGKRGASFVYMDVAPARNCMRGMIRGRETIIFDQRARDPLSEMGEGFEVTVVGFRVAPDSFCRDRGVVQRTLWHVEKMGEWVFVYHGLVKPTEIASYVEEARARFEVAMNPKGLGTSVLPDTLADSAQTIDGEQKARDSRTRTP